MSSLHQRLKFEILAKLHQSRTDWELSTATVEVELAKSTNVYSLSYGTITRLAALLHLPNCNPETIFSLFEDE